MTSPAPTICVVDDDPSVLRALERLLRSAGQSVVTFGSPQAFLDSPHASAPGCLVLDYAMPGLDGLELQEALIQKNCAIPVIFLTGHGDIPITVQAMKGGAVDFLTKPVSDGVLLEAVRRALDRDRIEQQARSQRGEVTRRVDALTPREREVLGYVIAGRLNKQIAGTLGTGEKTIKVHRARVMEKMQARSVADLVRLAALVGIQPEDP